jgi:hypothetical protein
MPLHTETLSPKLPTFKQWRSQKPEVLLGDVVIYQVFTIFLPNKYPDVTFVTEEFRYSLRPNEGFLYTLDNSVNGSNDALLFEYQPSTEEVSILTLSEYVASDRRDLKVYLGVWKETKFGLTYAITPLTNKPGKGSIKVSTKNTMRQP